MQTAYEEGDRIGLLLDLDAGSLTVYKNDARLGVMQESGLTDAAGYRWAVSMCLKGDSALRPEGQKDRRLNDRFGCGQVGAVAAVLRRARLIAARLSRSGVALFVDVNADAQAQARLQRRRQRQYQWTRTRHGRSWQW